MALQNSKKRKTKAANDTSSEWENLGLCPELVKAVQRTWPGGIPTKIQAKAIPVGLSGADMIGIAETGSGKTGAFVLPTLQKLLDLHSVDETKTKQLFCIALAPTRELVVQISQQFQKLGEEIGVRVCTLIGGSTNLLDQTKALAKNPHVIVASPGRINDHINNTSGFRKQLRTVRTIIFDEADRLLALDFEEELMLIMKHFDQKKRPQTFLFSATMTKNVEKLERIAMDNAVIVQVADTNTVPETLQQWMKVVPSAEKINYLAALIQAKRTKSMIVFCNTSTMVIQLEAFLNAMNIRATGLYGKLNQEERLKNLDKFTSNRAKVLVTTEVSSRGIDIPNVDFVVNFDVPNSPKDYMHRIGRTARAGKDGEALLLVTQYDLEAFVAIEDMLYPENADENSTTPPKRIDCYTEVTDEDVHALIDRVQDAWAEAQAKTQRKKEVVYSKNHKKRKQH